MKALTPRNRKSVAVSQRGVKKNKTGCGPEETPGSILGSRQNCVHFGAVSRHAEETRARMGKSSVQSNEA